MVEIKKRHRERSAGARHGEPDELYSRRISALRVKNPAVPACSARSRLKLKSPFQSLIPLKSAYR